MSYNACAWLLDRHLDDGRGANLAIVCEGRRTTYADLHQSACAAANGFLALGLARGDRMLMVVNDEPAFVAAFLGALRVGIVPVPVSTMLTADDLAVIATDAGARALLVSQDYESYVTTIASRAPDVTTKIVVGEPTLPGVHAWNELDDRTDLPPVLLD
jgi:4-hydroxybenzoate-CoA ligase